MTTQEYNKSVQLYADRLFRFAVKSLRQEADAKDVVQRSFEKLWIKHKDVDFEKVKSYLFTTAYHTMIDNSRKNKRTDIVEQIPEIATRNSHHSFELIDSLQNALSTLPKIQQKLIMLRDYEGYSYKEIAEITELNESQVKVYIFRARKKLQEVLKRMEKTA